MPERIHLVFLFLILVVGFSVGCREHRRTSYIPKDLDDAHRELQKLLPDSEIQAIMAMLTEDEMINYHGGLGMALRNDWGLWSGSRLSRYFNQLGVFHPDDMSGIIFDTFWCKLHHQPFRIAQRVEEYQEYWRSQEKPVGGSPNDGGRIAWVIMHGSGKNTVHLGISTTDLSYWRYVCGGERRIEPASAEDRKSLDDLREVWKSSGQKLEDMLRE